VVDGRPTTGPLGFDIDIWVDNDFHCDSIYTNSHRAIRQYGSVR